MYQSVNIVHWDIASAKDIYWCSYSIFMASFPSYSVHLSAQNPTACRISGQRIWKVSGATKRAKRPLAKAGTCQVVRSACLHRWWKSDSENPKLVCLVLVHQIQVVPFCLAKNHTSGNPRTLAVAAWQPIKSNSICSKKAMPWPGWMPASHFALYIPDIHPHPLRAPWKSRPTIRYKGELHHTCQYQPVILIP